MLLTLSTFAVLCSVAASASLSAPVVPRPRPAAGAPKFIPASDPSVTYTGRTRVNGDGTRSFDWEATQINLNVVGASYVRATINATGGILGRFIAEVDGWEVSSFYVGGGNGALTTNDFFIAYDLYDTRHIRLIQSLEPAFAGANAGAFFTFVGFTTDGTAAAPTPRTRSIELVGDSISAGYGARGHAGTPYGCPVDDNTSGNYYTYNWMLAEAFSADLTVVSPRFCLGERTPAVIYAPPPPAPPPSP